MECVATYGNSSTGTTKGKIYRKAKRKEENEGERGFIGQ